MYQVDPLLLYSAITVFGTVMQAVTGTEWIALKWKSANITNHDLQRALRASYEDALNSITFAFRQKAGFLDKFGKKRLCQEITISFNDQFLNPFVIEKQLSAEEIRTLAANCPAYCKLLQASVDTILPLTEISNISIEDLLMTGHNLKGADDLYQLNSNAGTELIEKIRRVEGVPDLFYELLAYKGLLLGSIVFFFNERIKSDERVRSILMHSELQRIREEQNRQHHQQVALLEEALNSRTISFTTSLSPIRDNFSEVLSSLERVEAEIAQNTKYLERIYDMLCQDRGLSEKERRQLQTGLSTTFNLHDKYDFDESKPIGYGSVAVVYKAVHKGLKQERALKLLKPEHKDNPEIVERFLREATVLGDLNHRNIVRIYDSGGGGPDLNFYLEMEYVDGLTLRNLIQSEVFNWGRVLNLIRQLASAIQKMHEAGIIHRDLNPRNIMVDKRGSLKVMDFGVAKIIGVEGLTRDGQVVGTHNYMAPEQASGQRVDERADIFSFGTIVYELCTRRMPSVPPLPMRQYQFGVPVWLEGVVVKCLAQDKADRYSSMNDILDSIEDGPTEMATDHIRQIQSVKSPSVTSDKKASGQVETTGILTHPIWFWAGVTISTIGIILFIVVILGMFNVTVINPWWADCLGIAIVILPWLIVGSICLRKGMRHDTRISIDSKTDDLLWVLAAFSGFVGGIVSWLIEKDVNQRKAVNMLTMGILTTIIWSIPFMIIHESILTTKSKVPSSNLKAPSDNVAIISSNVAGTLPASTPTAINTITSTSENILYEDTFDDPRTGWDEVSKDKYEVGYTNGEYYISLKKQDTCLNTANHDPGDFIDFSLETNARLASGPSDTNYGLVFRWQDPDNYYCFMISGDGCYSIIKRFKGVWINLQKKTTSDVIKRGNFANKIKATCKGSRIDAYVNDSFLTTVIDDSYASGHIGVIADGFRPDGRAVFDYVRVYSNE